MNAKLEKKRHMVYDSSIFGDWFMWISSKGFGGGRMKKCICDRLAVAGVLLMLTGCAGMHQEESVVSIETGYQQDTTDSTEDAEETSEEESSAVTVVELESTSAVPQNPFEQYPKGVRGLEEYQPEDIPGYVQGDAYLSAYLNADAQTEDGYISLDGIFMGPGQVGYIYYSISDEIRSDNYYGGADEEDVDYSQYLISYDFKTDTVLGKLLFDSDGEAAYVEQAGANIWHWVSKDDAVYGTLYDQQLQEQGRMVREYGESENFSPDGERCYVVRDGRIWKKDTADETSDGEMIALSQDYSVDYLSGVVSDEAGADFAVTSGVAADLQKYNGIVNLQTGEFVYLQKQGNQSIYVDGGLLFGVDFTSDTSTEYDISYQNQNPLAYTWTGDEYIDVYSIGDGKVLFYYTDADEQKNWMHVELYDVGKQELLGSTTFDVPEINMWFLGTPYVLDEELVMPMVDIMGGRYFYRWDYAASDQSTAQMSVEHAVIPTELLAQIEYKWNPTTLVPGTCSSELAPLREKADALEEQYGVQIYIAEECGNMFGGYGVVPLSDYTQTEQALVQLSHEMAKYPEGFFTQFHVGWVEGIDIYLAGTLIGMEEGVLDYAGGFETTYNGRYALVIDATEVYNVGPTFHHELSHAIDDKIEEETDEDLLLQYEDEWNALNPPEEIYGSSYSDTYEVFGREEMLPFVYWYADTGNAYFIDDYSMTFPTEDRARLFEYIMQDERGYLDWEDEPHLREKLNYYAACIRTVFDTTGWTDILWEIDQ
jgi:hypothetical protein